VEFESDPEKERLNIEKHGITFKYAERVFIDPFRIEQYDETHSVDEDRMCTIGLIDDVVFVAYTERGDKARLITARKAEPWERRLYYGESESGGWYRANF
jgi:uncharacterized DUF497 family protein